MTTTENLQAAADSVTWDQPICYVLFAMSHPDVWPDMVDDDHGAALDEDAVRRDHTEAIHLNQIKHFQTIRDRIGYRHPAPDSAVIDVLHLHAIVEDLRRVPAVTPVPGCSDPRHDHGPIPDVDTASWAGKPGMAAYSERA